MDYKWTIIFIIEMFCFLNAGVLHVWQIHVQYT